MNRLSLKYQIAIVVFLLQIILLGVLFWKTFDMMRVSKEKQLEIKAQSVLFWVDEASRAAFIGGEYGDLQTYVSNLTKDPMVALVRIADRKNRIIVSTNQMEVGTAFLAQGNQDNPLVITRDIVNPAGNYDISIDMAGEDEIGRLGFLLKQMVDSVKGNIASIRESTQRLALATVSGGLGIWEWDIRSNRLNWDDRMFELYGVSRESFSSSFEAWERGLHPDDWPA